MFIKVCSTNSIWKSPTCYSPFPFQGKHLRNVSDLHSVSVIIIIYQYHSYHHDLQSVSPDGQTDGAGCTVPVVGVSQGEAEPKAPCCQAKAIFLNVRQWGQRLGYVLLFAAWWGVKDGTQILCRHCFNLSRQTRLHLCGKCESFVLQRNIEGDRHEREWR